LKKELDRKIRAQILFAQRNQGVYTDGTVNHAKNETMRKNIEELEEKIKKLENKNIKEQEKIKKSENPSIELYKSSTANSLPESSDVNKRNLYKSSSANVLPKSPPNQTKRKQKGPQTLTRKRQY
jgi:outer membrane murein-binding lipoprotein Lpp